MRKFVKYIVIACIVGLIIYGSTILFNKRPVINNTVEILPNSVQLIITPEYDQYLYNQDVWMVCKVINNTTQDYMMQDNFDWNTLNFKIKDPDGKTFGYKDGGDYAGKPKPVVLAPGEIFETVIHMGWHFASRTIEESETSGIYEVSAQYLDLKSNIVKFDLIAPEGVDKMLYERTFRTFKFRSPSILSEFQELQNLLEEYPSSKYSPQLYGSLLKGLVGYSDSSRFFYNFNRYIDNYKNSYQTYFIIGYLKNILTGELKWNSNDVEKEIQKIIFNNKGTKIEVSILYKKNSEILLKKMSQQN